MIAADCGHFQAGGGCVAPQPFVSALGAAIGCHLDGLASRSDGSARLRASGARRPIRRDPGVLAADVRHRVRRSLEILAMLPARSPTSRSRTNSSAGPSSKSTMSSGCFFILSTLRSKHYAKDGLVQVNVFVSRSLIRSVTSNRNRNNSSRSGDCVCWPIRHDPRLAVGRVASNPIR